MYTGISGRETRGFGAQWGTRGSLLSRIFSAVIPVAVVDQFRGEQAGTIYGLSGGTDGAYGRRPAVSLSSDFSDWYLHEIDAWFPIMHDVYNQWQWTEKYYPMAVNLYTYGPPVPYDYREDPVQWDQVGPFIPQLVTSASGSRGSVQMMAGTQSWNYPLGAGYYLYVGQLRIGGQTTEPGVDSIQVSDSGHDCWLESSSSRWQQSWDKKIRHHFDPPIRIRRGRKLALALNSIDDVFAFRPDHSLTVSALVSEIPNAAGDFST